MAYLRLVLFFTVAVVATLFSRCMANEISQNIIDQYGATISGPVDQKFSRKLKRVVSLSALSGSSAEIFCRPTIMKCLKSVLLKSEDINEQLLCLANNYPQLEELALESTAPLDRNYRQNLSKFTQLKLFQIKCSNTTQSMLDAITSKNLEILVLDNISLNHKTDTDFSHLKQLRLYNCEVASVFAGELKSPLLQEVSLGKCLIAQGAIKELQRIPTLKQLVIYRSKFSIDELNEFKKLRPDVQVILTRSGGTADKSSG